MCALTAQPTVHVLGQPAAGNRACQLLCCPLLGTGQICSRAAGMTRALRRGVVHPVPALPGTFAMSLVRAGLLSLKVNQIEISYCVPHLYTPGWIGNTDCSKGGSGLAV